MDMPNHFWLLIHQFGDAFEASGSTFDERTARVFAEFLTMSPELQSQFLEHLATMSVASTALAGLASSRIAMPRTPSRANDYL